MLYDAFISHASEDKDDFVRELATKLLENRIEVWYDEFTLKPGDSLRRYIDHGLSKSRFGIVVLSKDFFRKQWTNWELDGLVSRQISAENGLIIPIWHNINKSDILEYSPTLADKVAIDSKKGIDYVIKQINRVINPEDSTLIVARNVLIEFGFDAPLVTNDWWLDVLEYCGSYIHLDNPYLSFKIPWKGHEPKNRGEYIALHALQMSWQVEADYESINQLSHPEDVLEFIEGQPGLKHFCLLQPDAAAVYFPQLTIKEFDNFLSSAFDVLLQKLPYEAPFTCGKTISIRHQELGNYPEHKIAKYYFKGTIEFMTDRYNDIDYIIWLLSKKSAWLPYYLKQTLLKGIIEMPFWQWNEYSHRNDYVGSLSDEMHDCVDKRKKFKLSENIKKDIFHKISEIKKDLNLPDSIDELYNAFIENKLIENWIEIQKEFRRRRNEK